MNTRAQFLKAAVASFASGAAAAAVFNAAYWLVVRDFPSLVTSLIASQVVTWVWGGAQAYRLNRKWQRVLASYNLPALGEGIDIPHRPPVDDEDGAA
jgi:hypothetical protein